MMDTMKGDLPSMIWILVQANHRYGNPGIDWLCSIANSRLKTFELRRQG
jgi:hypothetical protein